MTCQFYPLDGSNKAGKLAAIISRCSNRLTFSYNAYGQLSVVYDSLSRPIQNGNLRQATLTEIHSQGRIAVESFVTINIYDALNRLIRTSDNLGHTRRLYYDSRNLVIKTSDATRAGAAKPTRPLYRRQYQCRWQRSQLPAAKRRSHQRRTLHHHSSASTVIIMLWAATICNTSSGGEANAMDALSKAVNARMISTDRMIAISDFSLDFIITNEIKNFDLARSDWNIII